MAFRRTARSATRTQDGLLKSLGVRSGLEVQEKLRLTNLGVRFQYEPGRLSYEVAETKTYTPDFALLDNGIVVETKGWFTSADRKKHKLIKAQYPDLDLRFVFSNPNNKIGKKSKTTYAKWCDDHGFQFAAKTTPLEWTKEPLNAKSLAIITSIMKEEQK